MLVLVTAVRTLRRRSETRYPRGSGARSGRARKRGHFPVRRRTARVSSAGDTVGRHAIGRCDNFVELGTEEMAKLRRGRLIARARCGAAMAIPGGLDGTINPICGCRMRTTMLPRCRDLRGDGDHSGRERGRGRGRHQDQNLRPRN